MKKRTRTEFETVAFKTYRGFVRVGTQNEGLEVLAAKDALVLVERGKPRTLKMRCPCDRGHIITVNLDETIEPAWHIRIAGPSLSLFPSVWLKTGCECHFVLRRNRVYIFGRRARVPSRREVGGTNFE